MLIQAVEISNGLSGLKKKINWTQSEPEIFT